MKSRGIIHPQLMEALTSLGHTDSFLLCDAGFPIPAGARRIDLALTPGMLPLKPCLNAILREVVVEGYSVAAEMREMNAGTFEYLAALLPRQALRVIPQREFLEEARGRARFFVRTGELRPYANVLLTAASGVERFHRDFIVDPALFSED